MNAIRQADLKERLDQACYQHILPHMERYRATPCLEDCLPLMEPCSFAAFANQALGDVTGLVLRGADLEYRRRTRGLRAFTPALRQLEVGGADEAELRNELFPCLGHFARALEQYAPELDRFRQVLGQAPGAA